MNKRIKKKKAKKGKVFLDELVQAMIEAERMAADPNIKGMTIEELLKSL